MKKKLLLLFVLIKDKYWDQITFHNIIIIILLYNVHIKSYNTMD